MYRVFGDLFNKIYLTEVMTGNALHREKNDALFEYPIDHRKWEISETRDVPAGPHDDYPSRFSVLERRTKTVRYVEVEDYYTEVQTKKVWLQAQLDLFDDTTMRNQKAPLSVPYQYKLFAERIEG